MKTVDVVKEVCPALMVGPGKYRRGVQRRPHAGAALAAFLLVSSSAFSAHPSKAEVHAPTTFDTPSHRVDLNKASMEELMTLKGIGRKKAKAIIAHRQRRPFTRMTQLLKVKGIGRKTLQRLRPYLAISAAKDERSSRRRIVKASGRAKGQGESTRTPTPEQWRGMVTGCK